MSDGPTHCGWNTTPLRHLCTLNPPVSFNDLADDEDVTFLPMDKVKAGYFIPHVDKVANNAASYNPFAEGDILLAKVTPCFENGNIAIAENLTGGRGFGSSELFVLRPTRVLGKFLFYSLQSPLFKQEGEASMTGAGGLKRVSPDLLRQYRLCHPNEATQQSIADYLDRETARLDALIAVKERLLALLAEKRQALITRAVTCGLDPNVPLHDSGIPWLGMIPKHWERTRIKLVAEVRGGLTLGKAYGETKLVEYPYLRVANVQDGHLNLLEITMVEVPQSEARLYELRKGDVLMNEGGDADKLGRGCIWEGDIDPCLHQNHVFAVRPTKVTSAWLDLWTSSDVAKAYFESRARQSTNLASISATNIKEHPLPLPPEGEQLDIVRYVRKALVRIDAVRFATNASIALLKERRSALIAAAVTGQIPIPSESIP